MSSTSLLKGLLGIKLAEDANQNNSSSFHDSPGTADGRVHLVNELEEQWRSNQEIPNSETQGPTTSESTSPNVPNNNSASARVYYNSAQKRMSQTPNQSQNVSKDERIKLILAHFKKLSLIDRTSYEVLLELNGLMNETIFEFKEISRDNFPGITNSDKYFYAVNLKKLESFNARGDSKEMARENVATKVVDYLQKMMKTYEENKKDQPTSKVSQNVNKQTDEKPISNSNLHVPIEEESQLQILTRLIEGVNSGLIKRKSNYQIITDLQNSGNNIRIERTKCKDLFTNNPDFHKTTCVEIEHIATFTSSTKEFVDALTKATIFIKDLAKLVAKFISIFKAHQDKSAMTIVETIFDDPTLAPIIHFNAKQSPAGCTSTIEIMNVRKFVSIGEDLTTSKQVVAKEAISFLRKLAKIDPIASSSENSEENGLEIEQELPKPAIAQEIIKAECLNGTDNQQNEIDEFPVSAHQSTNIPIADRASAQYMQLRSELLRDFLSVYSAKASVLKVFNAFRDKSKRKFKLFTRDYWPFPTTARVESIEFQISYANNYQDSRAKSMENIENVFKRLLDLIRWFRKEYSPEASPTQFINDLIAKHPQIIYITKQDDKCRIAIDYSFIVIEEVGQIESTFMKASNKLIEYLQHLSKIVDEFPRISSSDKMNEAKSPVSKPQKLSNSENKSQIGPIVGSESSDISVQSNRMEIEQELPKSINAQPKIKVEIDESPALQSSNVPASSSSSDITQIVPNVENKIQLNQENVQYMQLRSELLRDFLSVYPAKKSPNLKVIFFAFREKSKHRFHLFTRESPPFPTTAKIESIEFLTSYGNNFHVSRDKAMDNIVNVFKRLLDLIQWFRKEYSPKVSPVKFMNDLIEKHPQIIYSKKQNDKCRISIDCSFIVIEENGPKESAFLIASNKLIGYLQHLSKIVEKSPRISTEKLNEAKNPVAKPQNSSNNSEDKSQISTAKVLPKPVTILKRINPQLIYEAVVKQWKSLVQNNSENWQFRMIAAFVLTSDHDSSDVRVLSIGTGNKCLQSKEFLKNQKAVHDSHAEITARRALLCYLYKQLKAIAKSGYKDRPEFILERVPDANGFRLKPFLKLHLYLSSAPCGDGRMFQFPDVCNQYNNSNKPKILRVKASDIKENIQLPDDYIITLEAIENGESNLAFMSCSDKIAMWNVVGVQGSLLSSFIEPLYIHSLVVSDRFDFENIKRAVYGRIDQTMLASKLHGKNVDSLYRLNCHLVENYKPFQVDPVFQPNLPKTNPISHNWFRPIASYRPVPVEILNSRTGQPQDDSASISRLQKKMFSRLFMQLIERFPEFASIVESHRKSEPEHELEYDMRDYYRGLKYIHKPYLKAKNALKETFKESGLGKWHRTPINVDVFDKKWYLI